MKPPGRNWSGSTPGRCTACVSVSRTAGQEAQDLTQEVFLRVFRTIKTFRSTEGCFHTWLARVTRNLLIDHYRRTRQERVTDSIEEQLPMLEEAGAAAAVRPDQALAGREASADSAGDAAEAIAGFAGSGDFAGSAGNGIPGNRGGTGHPGRHGEVAESIAAGRNWPGCCESRSWRYELRRDWKF